MPEPRQERLQEFGIPADGLLGDALERLQRLLDLHNSAGSFVARLELPRLPLELRPAGYRAFPETLARVGSRHVKYARSFAGFDNGGHQAVSAGLDYAEGIPSGKGSRFDLCEGYLLARLMESVWAFMGTVGVANSEESVT